MMSLVSSSCVNQLNAVYHTTMLGYGRCTMIGNVIIILVLDDLCQFHTCMFIVCAFGTANVLTNLTGCSYMDV